MKEVHSEVHQLREDTQEQREALCGSALSNRENIVRASKNEQSDSKSGEDSHLS